MEEKKKTRTLRFIQFVKRGFNNLSDVNQKLTKGILLVVFILSVEAIFNYPIRNNIIETCDNSKTIQKYDTLKLSCAVLVLDWKQIDDILSGMDVPDPLK